LLAILALDHGGPTATRPRSPALCRDARKRPPKGLGKSLIATAPQTLVGLRTWAAYLGEISDSGEAWMFEKEGATLVATFAEALSSGNLAV